MNTAYLSPNTASRKGSKSPLTGPGALVQSAQERALNFVQNAMLTFPLADVILYSSSEEHKERT